GGVSGCVSTELNVFDWLKFESDISELKKVAIAILALLCVLMVNMFQCCLPGGGEDLEESARWMTNADAKLLAMPLNRVALVGSHNSGSYAKRARSKCHSGDCDRNLAKYLKIPPVGFVVRRWAKCQKISILRQLEHGIRYLDIRVQIHESEMHLCHSLCFLDAEAMMDQLVTFLDAKPHELVVVDVNHAYSDVEGGHEKFLNIFLQRIGRSRVATPTSHTPSSTLQSFRDAGVQVVLIYDEPGAAANANVWGPSTIVSVWPNLPTAEQVLEHGRGLLLEEVDEEETRLRVLQLLPTPAGKDLARYISVLHFSSTIVRLAPKWLKDLCTKEQIALSRANIVLMDDAVHGKNALFRSLQELNEFKSKNYTSN
ncbi:PI-PLC X domain-containing protein 3-like, partial [Thraustotheca clavata]